MNKTKLAVAIGLLATTPLSNASDDGDSLFSDLGLSQSASVALTTDYVWRGISQTHNDPAIQGQFDISHESGLYIGAWASNVEFRDGSKNSLELDAYGGFSNEIDLGGIGLTYDVGWLHYEFPANSSGNINEVYFGLGISPIEDLNFSAYYYHDTGIENKVANYYVDVSADYTLPDWALNTTIVTHVGHYDRQNGDSDYWDWKIGLAKDIGGSNFEVAYLDTDEGSGNLSDERVVATISRELGGSSAASQDMLPDGFTTSASVALTTDYVWRGVSQTNEDPAIQGSFDVAHKSGLYIGAWASNIEFGSDSSASMELDLYAGFSNEVDIAGLDLTYDIGWLHYEYPSESGLNFNEVYFGLAASPVENLDLGVYYYHDVGVEHKIGNYYVDTTANYTLPGWAWNTQIVTGIAYYDMKGDGAPDYWNWKAGLAKDIGDFNVEVAYQDTDESDWGNLGDERVVATISSSF